MPILVRLIGLYKIWHEYLKTFPKTSRYSLGVKIDNLFTEVIEVVAAAAFTTKENKSSFIKKALAKSDALKIFLQIAWEIHSLDDKKYIALSFPLNEIGRMLGGWHNQTLRQNSPAKAGEK